jgi:hypothetical protein
MKYLGMLGAVAIIYWIFARETPIASVTQAMTQTEIAPAVSTAGPARQPTPAPAPGSGLRRPMDRTRATLDAVRARNGGGEF